MNIFTGPEPKFGIVCECDDESCRQRFIVTVAEYEHVRTDPLLFFVAPGHEDLRIERVMRTGDTHFVVRKLGEAAEVAEETAERGRGT